MRVVRVVRLVHVHAKRVKVGSPALPGWTSGERRRHARVRHDGLAQPAPWQVARKQFAGLELREHAHEVVYAIRGALWVCALEATTSHRLGEPDLAALAARSAHSCEPDLKGVQTAVGEPQPVATTADGCGAWMPPEFRVCAPELKGKPEQTILRRNGVFYTQGYQEDPRVHAEGGRCRQVAIFHMQEWKKLWADGKPHMDPTAEYDTFRLSQEGIRRLVPA